MRSTRALVLGGLLLYGGWLWSKTGAYASGSDPSGYLNFARLLLAGQWNCPQPSPLPPIPDLSEAATIPLGFRPMPGQHMAPTYPIGLPLLLALGQLITGPATGPHLVMWLHALAGLALTFAIGRKLGLDRGLAAMGLLVLATSQQYLFSSLHCMSDLPAMVWGSGAVWLAWLARSQDRRWAWLALAAGAAFGMGVLIRPANLMLVWPILFCLASSPWRFRALLCFGLGGLPLAVVLLATNQAAYGQALTSGYGDLSSLFRLKYVPLALLHYARWLPVVLSPLVLLGLGWPVLLNRARFEAWLLMLWVLPSLAFYSVFKHTHDTWWYLRFLLPVFPPLLMGGLRIGSGLLRSRRIRAAVAAAVVLWALFWESQLHVSGIGSGELAHLQIARWTQKNLHRQGVILTLQLSGCLTYYTDFSLLRWDTMRPDDWQRLARWCEQQQRPLYAVLFPFEIEQGALKRCPWGQWEPIGQMFAITMWRWDPAPGAPGRSAPPRSPN